MAKILKEVTLSQRNCLEILRGETVTDKATGLTFNLVKDEEGSLVKLDDGFGRKYYQREGTAICIEKTSKIKYEFFYTEAGSDPDDLQCDVSGYLTQVN